jgi:dephospho-CoA kinase
MMSNPLKIGITGGIGSGKSLVSKLFKTLGIPVYNSDDRAKHLTKTNQQIKEQIFANFGSEVFDSNHELITSNLAKIVFNDSQKLDTLNAIVHPIVAQDFENWVVQQKAPYVIKEAAIIFEHSIQKSLDAVILVVCPLEIRLKHLLKRDPFRTEEDILAIISKQMSDEAKIPLADYIVNNNEQELLLTQVLHIHSKILNP